MKPLSCYAVPAPPNIESLACHETTLNYVRTLSDGSLWCCGLHAEPSAVLIDRKSDLSRLQIDTLHDYCLFAHGAKGDLNKPFHAEHAAAMAVELREMGIEPPESFVVACGFSYPGSRTFAFEIGGNLVIP